jgi:SOS-response transcriptional repressor LexA
MNTPADEVVENITPSMLPVWRAMEAQGKRKADFGRLLGLDSSQTTKTFQGRRKLQLAEARKVEQWLGISVGAQEAGAVVAMPGMVPLHGWVGASSPERRTFAEEAPLGFVPMHPNQANLREAWAVQVRDDSMSPRYEPGETVYLAPNQQPRKNEYAVIVTVDGFGHLKRFLNGDADKIYVEQLNPPEQLEFARSNVRAIHRVVGSG